MVWGRTHDGGSEAELVSLFDEHAPDLLRWFYVRTFCWDSASDLTSETFAVAVEQLGRRDPSLGSAGAWLWGVARNMLARFHERERVDSAARQRLGVQTPTYVDGSFDDVDARIDARRVLEGIAARPELLSSRLAEAVYARVVDDEPYEQVAHRLDCSPGAARVRVSRALSQLFDAVTSEQGESVP